MNVSDIARLVPWSRVLAEVGADTGHGRRTRCPVHQGNNPSSFSYSESTGRGSCYSCGWHGDKLDFLRAVLGLDFKSALGRLADMAGVDLGKCRRPSSSELARARAHRAAVAAARSAYEAWQRQKLVQLTDLYRELVSEQELAAIALRAAARRPDLYNDEETRRWERELGEIYDRLPTLGFDLDVLTYDRLEAERLAWWKDEEAEDVRPAA